MEDIKKTYEKSSLRFIGNSNSLHNLGINSKKLENASTKQILEILKLSNKEIIYTSGREENYTLILNNVLGDKKIITDNKCFYEIGKAIGKNIIFDEHLQVTDDVYLVSTINDIDLSNYKCFKHISLRKGYNKYSNFDYITIDDLIPFFGCLIKDKNKILLPLIHGGKSTTDYRSGTAVTSLIATFSKKVKKEYKN